MKLIYGISTMLHRIRIKLYPNYLPGYEKTFLARSDSEAKMGIDDIANSLINRSHYKGGDFGQVMEHVNAFLEEAMYQLCDGYTVNLKYFSMHTHVGGNFQSASETPDPQKHPLTIHFHLLSPLRKLAEGIHVTMEGEADTSGHIYEFIDVENDSINGVFEPGGQFILHGHKLKTEGEDPSVGVYFVPVDDPSKAKKVKKLAENSPSKIIGISPQTGHQYNKIEIRTQYEGSTSKFLKNVRVITSGFTVEEA